MNIIIPIGGKGERFLKNGYKTPKPLIKIFDKCMIEYILDNLTITSGDNVFIIYNYKLDDHNFFDYINKKYSFIHFIKIKDTKGAVETLYLGLDYIFSNYKYNKKCLILDCDTFYTQDIITIFTNSSDNMVFYTNDENIQPIYSYIELKNNNITNIKEKEKISNNANTGAYAFTDINVLFKYCKYVLDNNIMFNNEPYTSCVISEMIKKNIMFKGYELKKENVFSLGTPIDVNNYINNTYAFLFDLDGTLVITDDIYFNVWYKILIKYNIVLTKEIFDKYIQGNNDKFVLNSLLSNIDISLDELSELKDVYFIENIDNLKIINGIYEFIEKIKLLGHKICIVTNCNNKVAVEIVKHIKINKMIDFIISNNDVINGKPNTEPYKKAIERYNIINNKCFIFEDSKSGLLSGKNVNPKLLIGIETIYNNNELINYGVDLSIKNYSNITIEELIYNTKSNIDFKNIIKQSSTIQNIKNIDINENKLKGGFIADVICFNTITENKIYSQILKYENTRENNLSIIAKKLELYDREYYFYTDISKHININIPIFYHLVYDENQNKIGIVLENLLDKGYKVNLDLNIESIDISLKIVDRMARMHSKFWNKNIKKLFPDLKNSNDKIFCPFFKEFINEKYDLFKNKWFHLLNNNKIQKCNEMYENFSKIQQNFSTGNHLTFIHGDVKSPNIFYDIKNNNDPYFIDWQHCAIGKGVQDLIFFIIESFDIINLKSIYYLIATYYYKKLIEYGITNYSVKEYEKDLYEAICYIPFFTSIWFGTIPQDELIDKNFPYFFINKMFYLIELCKKIEIDFNT
jgi:HAD superfamily hydrolase (TIGR01509 family)